MHIFGDGSQTIRLSLGMGVNSIAILCLMKDYGVRPDLITFADTGGEKPHTYSYITVINNWLFSNGFPQVTIVKKVYKDGSVANLYDHSIERNMLPSLAYGFKNCSQKFKIEPQSKFANNFELFKGEWKAGRKVLSILGYDFDEERRVLKSKDATVKDKKYDWFFPLYELGIDREGCEDIIKAHGLPLPGKSACFYCPASTYNDIRVLEQHYPELLEKALKLESNAELTSIKGLGRRFNWAQFVSEPDMFGDFPSDWEMPCGCHEAE